MSKSDSTVIIKHTPLDYNNRVATWLIFNLWSTSITTDITPCSPQFHNCSNIYLSTVHCKSCTYSYIVRLYRNLTTWQTFNDPFFESDVLYQEYIYSRTCKSPALSMHSFMSTSRNCWNNYLHSIIYGSLATTVTAALPKHKGIHVKLSKQNFCSAN